MIAASSSWLEPVRPLAIEVSMTTAVPVNVDLEAEDTGAVYVLATLQDLGVLSAQAVPGWEIFDRGVESDGRQLLIAVPVPDRDHDADEEPPPARTGTMTLTLTAPGPLPVDPADDGAAEGCACGATQGKGLEMSGTALLLLAIVSRRRRSRSG